MRNHGARAWIEKQYTDGETVKYTKQRKRWCCESPKVMAA